MRQSKNADRLFLVLSTAMVLGVALVGAASTSAAYSSFREAATEPAPTSPVDVGQADLDGAPFEMGATDPVGPFEIAQSYRGERDHRDNRNNRNDVSRQRRDRPSAANLRGHEQRIEVRRRPARPIPRVHYSTKRRSYYRNHRPRYYSSHYYGHRHFHHAHCGHSYWDYGDAFESRTLGRACIYGTKGEVIYKPADVICAPDESVTSKSATAPPERPAAPSATAPSALPVLAPAPPAQGQGPVAR